MGKARKKLKFPQRWVTLQDPPRFLRADGIAAASPDCLVAFFEDGSLADNGDAAVWILFDGDPDKDIASVIGLTETRALRLSK